MRQPIDFQPTIRLVFGENSMDKLRNYVSDFGFKNILIVTDPGIVKAGIVEKAQDLLKKDPLQIYIYKDIESNPTTEHVEQGVLFTRDKKIDLIIAIGGGSAMDTAKGINFLLSNGGKMEDYWGKNKARHPMLPSIGIPTTAGTGSEAQSFAIIAQKDTNKKMACGDIKARFSLVILDPDVLKTVPLQTAIVTGIDAISHTIESYVAKTANTISQMFARQAWNLLNESFEKVVANQADTQVRGDMLLGAHLAGLSIENSMLGAAHAMANPVSAKLKIDHGLAVGLALPHVIEFNAQYDSALYAGFELDEDSEKANKNTADYLIKRVYDLIECAQLPLKLKEYGIVENDLATLAGEAEENWTAKFNPRPLSKQDFLHLYECAF